MRSEAQKAADRKYREAHKNDSVKWGTRLKAEEAAVYDAILQQHPAARAALACKQGRFCHALKQRKRLTDTLKYGMIGENNSKKRGKTAILKYF